METYSVLQAYKDDDLEFKLEECDGVYLIHCTTTNANLSTLKKGRQIFNHMLNVCSFFGCEEVFTYTQEPKFVELTDNPIYLQRIEVEEEEYEVYKWELKQL